MVALAIAFGNMLEALVGVFLFRRFADAGSRLDRVRDVGVFVLVGIFSTMISAVVGVLALRSAGIVSPADFLVTFRAWWVGDLLSDLIVAPLLIIWSQAPWMKLGFSRKIEGLSLGALVVGLGVVLFSDFPLTDLHRVIQPHWIFLFLIWALLRFGQHAGVLMTFVLSGIAITGTVLGRGPYSGSSLGENLLQLQLFSSAVALSGLFFGALARELERALQIRTDFISIASHELRTPLASLKMSLQLLREESGRLPEKGPFERIFLPVDRQMNRLTGLVDSLLNVAQIESGNLVLTKKDTDLSTLVLTVTEEVGKLFPKNPSPIDLEVQPLIRGEVSAYGVEQILTNLLMNSMKYGAGKPVRISLSQTGKTATLVISDQGRGIPPEHLRKIFERYHRVNPDDQTAGLGLGLYVSKLLIDAHAGSIRVESTPGSGSTFTVELPV